MSWAEAAREAARVHAEVELAAQAALARPVMEYLARFAVSLGLEVDAKPKVVQGGLVTLALPSVAARKDWGPQPWRLSCAVTHEQRPAVQAEVWGEGVSGQRKWISRGQVETLVDLGRALDPDWHPEDDEPDAEQGVGDMLATVLEAIVREVVHDVIDGRLGDG